MPNYLTELSPDNNNHVYQIKDKEAAPIDLLKDTVGWVGKNKAKSSFVTNNTAKDSNLLFVEGELEGNKDYILSFETDGAYNLYVNTNLCSEITSFVTTSGSNEVRFTTASTISKSNTSQYNTTYGWRVLLNSIAQASAISLTNIMLRDASIVDNTFEPYHESVEFVLEKKGDWDSRNLFDKDQEFLQLYIDASNNVFKTTVNGRMGVVKILPNTKYRITKSAGKTFRIALSSTFPQNNSSLRYTQADHTATEMEVTTDASDVYLAVYFWSTDTGDTGTPQAMADTVMVQLASNTNKSYTEHREPLDIVIPSKMSYADNGVLGAKNLYWGISGTNENVAVTSTSDGYRVVASTSETWRNAYTVFDNLKKNTDYKIVSSVDFTSGKGDIQVHGSNDGSNFTYITSSGAITSDRDVAVRFNTGDYRYIRIRLYVTTDTASTADITFGKLMLRLASDPDDTYVPYAMTNRELTENVAELNAGHFFGGNFPFYIKRYTLSANKSLKITGASSYQNYFIFGDSQLMFIVQNSPTNSFINSLSEKSTGITPTITHVEDKIVKLNNAQSYGLGLLIISMSDFSAETVTT